MQRFTFPGGSVVKNLPANAGDAQKNIGSIPGLGRFPGEGNPIFLPREFPRQWSLEGNSP